jgi:proline iminopeptidase
MKKERFPKTIARFFIILFLGALATLLVQGEYQKVNSSGLDVHYRVFGTGTPVLIIGGGPGDVADRYLSLSEGLAKKHRSVLVDQRGTGKSSPAVFDSSTISLELTLADFEAIRKQLGLKQWVVLGFSYGGYLASLYAESFPASVSSLVLLGSMGLNTGAFTHFDDNITSRLWAADLERVSYWSDPLRLAENRNHAITEIIRAKMPGYFFDRKKSLLVSQTMKEADFNFDLGDWLWKDIVKKDLAKADVKFAKPVLILQGRQDPLGETVAQTLASFYPDSKLIFIEKCGHYSWIEQPEKVFASITEFLAAGK